MKKYLCLLLCLCLIFSAVGCSSRKEAGTCTLSISCAVLLEHMDELSEGKQALVPENGWILPPTEMTFYEGDSVFDVLQRAVRANKIHMEHSTTPLYHTAYIKGIGNLYEFDCGELSGWVFSVNDQFPKTGCSACSVQPGDVIAFQYTCDLGIDVGGPGEALS